LAKEYGMLPSYVRLHADTYDVMVLDVMAAWEDHQRSRASGNPSTPQLSEEEMMKMIEATRR
jgi:hypothetical protein